MVLSGLIVSQQKIGDDTITRTNMRDHAHMDYISKKVQSTMILYKMMKTLHSVDMRVRIPKGSQPWYIRAIINGHWWVTRLSEWLSLKTLSCKTFFNSITHNNQQK